MHTIINYDKMLFLHSALTELHIFCFYVVICSYISAALCMEILSVNQQSHMHTSWMHKVSPWLFELKVCV